MIDVQEQHGGSVVALMEVDPGQIHLYGSAAVVPTGDDNVVRITDLVEKPAAGEAPSSYAIIGRYVLDPAIFGVLGKTRPGRGGEIQLTDALRELAQAGGPDGPVHGVIFKSTALRHRRPCRLSACHCPTGMRT